MGAWILASVFYACFLLIEAKSIADATSYINIQPVRMTRQTEELDANAELPVEGEGDIHSAVSIQNNPETSATNYQPYNVKLYALSAENGRETNPYNIYNGYDAGSYEEDPKRNQFNSVETETGYNNQNLEAEGYEHYKTATSFNLEGPRQLETITTNSFHKESEPYDVSDYQKSHHKEEEQHAEVHYHQHKHMHKHSHKQEHMHKHQQDHKHDHGHKHNHHAQHDHKHDSQHKHEHKSEHKHAHKNDHHHSHHQDHKHSHHAAHKHEHKHQQEHKHDQHHGHKHSHHGDHKHSHHQEHKHDHHHGHKHENKHQHKHEHHGEHKHHHGHKEEHKHQHHDSHQHKHSHHKH